MSEESADVKSTSNPPGRTVTWRSATIGLLGALIINLFTPYNDYVLNNTPFIGNYLPPGLVLLVLIIVLCINIPLSRLAPHASLRRGEIAVATAMMLVSCALPSSGLMRYLPSSLVGIHYHAGLNPTLLEHLNRLDLPDWIFPAFQSDDPVRRTYDPVITDFVNRVPLVGDAWVDRINAVPWSAWVRPALTWLVLLAAMAGAILCITAIVHRQWVENERLPFPLANVYLSLVEQPEAGRLLNPLLRNRGFWLAAGFVFALHFINGLATYWPAYLPRIPLGFDLNAILTDGPLRHTDGLFKRSELFFSVVGITMFLQTKIAFSLWFFFLLRQLITVLAGTYNVEVGAGLQDQVFGATVAFGILIVWLGRHHFAATLRQMFRKPHPDEPQGLFLPYPLAGWGLMVCFMIAVGWLVAAGAPLITSVVIVLMFLLVTTVIARVVAETGLIYATIGVWFVRPWIGLLPLNLTTSAQGIFFTNYANHLTVPGMRESLSVFASHGQKLAHDTMDQAPPRRTGRTIMLLLALTLLLSYCASGAATLYVNYNFATPLGGAQDGPINPGGLWGSQELLTLLQTYSPPYGAYREGYGPLTHMVGGAGVTFLLAALRAHLAWWPLHPVGYLLWQSLPLARVWFSILLGWLAKVLIVRYGGSQMYQAARFTFIGLIIGEVAAASFWLVVTLVLAYLGLDYQPIQLLPN